jgi:hypothetical protein
MEWEGGVAKFKCVKCNNTIVAKREEDYGKFHRLAKEFNGD